MKALVLSGGGSKGAWQLGVLKRLMAEQNCDYEILSGVSVGALTISGISQTPIGRPKEAIEKVIKLWLNHVQTNNVYRRWWPFGRLHALWLKSVYDSQPLIDLVCQHFDHEKILNSGRKIAIGAICLDDGEQRFVRETDENFLDWILASASFPVFLNPIMIGGKLWSDGGIKKVTPIGQAIKMGADEIDVLVTTNPWVDDRWSSTKKRAIPDQIVRTLELMNDKIMQDDIKITQLKNKLADIDKTYKKVKMRVFVPSKKLTDNSLEFDPKQIRQMLKQGYEDASRFLSY